MLHVGEEEGDTGGAQWAIVCCGLTVTPGLWASPSSLSPSPGLYKYQDSWEMNSESSAFGSPTPILT